MRAFIIVKLLPQSIAEEPFFEKDVSHTVKPPQEALNVKDSSKPRQDKDESADKPEYTEPSLSPPPVKSLLSQPSRLVFKVPQGIAPIRYDLESLLEFCGRSELSVTETVLAREDPRVDRFTSSISATATAL